MVFIPWWWRLFHFIFFLGIIESVVTTFVLRWPHWLVFLKVILFHHSLFIGDMNDVLEFSKFHMYADFLPEAEGYAVYSADESGLRKIFELCRAILLRMNPAKFMVLPIYKGHATLFLGDDFIPYVYTAKNLSATFNYDLKCGDHVCTICRKCGSCGAQETGGSHLFYCSYTNYCCPCDSYFHYDSYSLRKLTVAFNAFVRYGNLITSLMFLTQFWDALC
jgi:hypothetical protein